MGFLFGSYKTYSCLCSVNQLNKTFMRTLLENNELELILTFLGIEFIKLYNHKKA